MVGGFTLPANGSHGVGALLLGYYDGKKLIYAGRTGTGFTQKTHQESARCTGQAACGGEVRSTRCRLRRGGERSGCSRAGGAGAFATWTADNLVRQAAFQGLREDKPAKEVRREEPSVAPRPRGTRQASYTAASGAAAKVSVGKAKVSSRAAAGSAPVRLTHPEKILDAESQLTKQQLADYYWAIAPHMLPHIAGRPLSLVRCPEGSGKPCFFQKHVNHMLPPGIGTVDVPDKKTGKMEPYITLSTARGAGGVGADGGAGGASVGLAQ